MKELSDKIRINFQNNPNSKLANPAKSDIGIVSKHYIDQIYKSIREKLNVNQEIHKQ